MRVANRLCEVLIQPIGERGQHHAHKPEVRSKNALSTIGPFQATCFPALVDDRSGQL